MKFFHSLPWMLGPLLVLTACGTQSVTPTQPQLSTLALPAPPYYDQAIAIPMYQYPMTAPNVYAPLWTATVAAQKKTGLVKVAVVNVNSGPYANGQVDANYVKAIGYLKQNAVPVYGYVTSSYANRPLAEVKADINAWISAYGVKNVFVDEVSAACNSSAVTAYYSQLASFIRSKGSAYKIILNPGTTDAGSECLMKYGDIIATFENAASVYASFTPPAWTTKYRPERFWHMIHSIGSQAEQTQVLDGAYDKWAGLVFATSDTMPNPYDTVSTYWDAYINQVGGF